MTKDKKRSEKIVKTTGVAFFYGGIALICGGTYAIGLAEGLIVTGFCFIGMSAVFICSLGD